MNKRYMVSVRSSLRMEVPLGAWPAPSLPRSLLTALAGTAAGLYRVVCDTADLPLFTVPVTVCRPWLRRFFNLNTTNRTQKGQFAPFAPLVVSVRSSLRMEVPLGAWPAPSLPRSRPVALAPNHPTRVALLTGAPQHTFETRRRVVCEVGSHLSAHAGVAC
jgi:hypothetical protein